MIDDKKFREYKLTKITIKNLYRLTGDKLIPWSNSSIKALNRRGLAYHNNDDPTNEGWELTEKSYEVLKYLNNKDKII